MSEFNWEGYSKWQAPPSLHEECGCLEICHEAHWATGDFPESCEFCLDEKCGSCGGTGYQGDLGCTDCGGQGRIRIGGSNVRR